MPPAEFILVQGVRNDALKLFSQGFGHKLLDIHDRHIVFAAEPVASFTNLWFAKVAAVAARYFPTRPVILPKAIFEESL